MAYDVSALRKSIAVLSVLADCDDALGVTELARRAGVAKNMAFRICQTLEAQGWLHAEEGPRYRLTLVPFHLFSKPLERAQLTTACQEPLQELARRCGETVYISVPDGLRAVHVQVIEGHGPVRVAGALGSAFDLHSTAQGKVFLAHDHELAHRVLAGSLARHTPRTLTDPARLQRDLASVRRQGYGLNREEYARGLVGAAAPIRSREDRVVAAVGVFAPSARLGLAALKELATAELIPAAATISARLGAMPEG